MLFCVFSQVNTEIVAIQRVITPAGEAQLKGLIQQQAAKTGSKKAAALLADWANAKGKFWQIVPPGECVWVYGMVRHHRLYQEGSYAGLTA